MPPSPRRATTRDSTSRKKSYKPPSYLDAPDPRDPDTAHRWLRVAIQNEDDAKNISMHRRDGWEFVRSDAYPEFDAPVHQEGRFAGCIGIGDLVLAVNSKENVEARQDYFDSMTARREQAVDSDLLKAQHPSMPITSERNTGVIHGQRRVNLDD